MTPLPLGCTDNSPSRTSTGKTTTLFFATPPAAYQFRMALTHCTSIKCFLSASVRPNSVSPHVLPLR